MIERNGIEQTHCFFTRNNIYDNFFKKKAKWRAEIIIKKKKKAEMNRPLLEQHLFRKVFAYSAPYMYILYLFPPLLSIFSLLIDAKYIQL